MYLKCLKSSKILRLLLIQSFLPLAITDEMGITSKPGILGIVALFVSSSFESWTSTDSSLENAVLLYSRAAEFSKMSRENSVD